MVSKKICVATFLAALGLAAAAPAQTFTALYNFTGPPQDGSYPWGGVIQGPAGDLFGTAEEGGTDEAGVIYEIDSAGTETVLHDFEDNGKSGILPTAPLLWDRAGNLYGTTAEGGPAGSGTVFRANAQGKVAVLHSFRGRDGAVPSQGLAIDKSGDVFGTTTGGGLHGRGTIFKVDKAGRFTLLHSFTGGPRGGARPWDGHLTIDESGNLYGVAENGGFHDRGVLYELSNDGRFAVLHSFGKVRSDGCFPLGSVVLDNAGNRYGVADGCGSYGYGVIWKLSKRGKETILHNFAAGASDGCALYASVTRDPNGNLYGVTSKCGANNWGTLYELSASGTYTLLHSFDSSDGALPYGEVLWTANGTLYGTTQAGGADEYGTVWKYVP